MSKTADVAENGPHAAATLHGGVRKAPTPSGSYKHSWEVVASAAPVRTGQRAV